MDTREELWNVLANSVEEKSLRDPDFTVEFWSEDGDFVTYELRYKGVVTKSCTDAVLSPIQFKNEILTNW